MKEGLWKLWNKNRKGTGISVFGALWLVVVMVFFEVLLTGLGFVINKVVFATMSVQGSEELIYSLFQVLGYLFFFHWMYKKRGIRLTSPGTWGGMDLFLLGIVLLGYILVYDFTIGNLVSQTFVEKDVTETLQNLVDSKWIGFAALLLVAPIFEEFVCRGVLLEQLRRRYPTWVAVFISSLLFGLIHMNFNQGINAFFIGCIFGIAYVKTNSLIPSICLHFMNNGFFYVLSFIEELPNGASPPVWAIVLTGAVLFIGGWVGYLLYRRKREKKGNVSASTEEMTFAEEVFSDEAIPTEERHTEGQLTEEVLTEVIPFEEAHTQKMHAKELLTDEALSRNENETRTPTAAFQEPPIIRWFEGLVFLRVFGTELFTAKGLIRIAVGVFLFDLMGNLANGALQLGQGIGGVLFFGLAFLLAFGYEAFLEKLPGELHRKRFTLFLFLVIFGGTLFAFREDGVMPHLWKPTYEALLLMVIGAGGILLTGREMEIKIRKNIEN